jgi:FlaA1/EpsC-like NDP-sugar epimerase
VIPINRHRVWNLVADAALVAAAWWLAFTLRFDRGVPIYYHTLFVRTIAFVIAIKLAVFILSGFYNRWWRYVSTRDMWGAARGVVIASLVADLTVYFASPVHNVRLPRSIAVLDFLLTLAFVAGTRLIARSIIERPQARNVLARGKEVIVVGAGIRSISRNLRLAGVRVLGTIADLPHVIRDNKPDELLIAIPSASGELRARVVDVAGDIPVKTLPGLHELIAGDINLTTQIRPIQVEDVLGREPVEVDIESIASYVRGETVLVTGAGGSIGSELCRQIAKAGPALLVLVDHHETGLFEIERELVDRDFAAVAPVLADVKNLQKMRQVFERFGPGVVFHAAAYKHVPMLEANPIEALRNNTVATRVLADVAVEFGAARFVLVSTDKAANPKNLLGCSKAIAEWIVEAYGHREDVSTRFVAVRFGNVLNSSGSVIPIFRRQIERGGPVRVTHPEMTRYFMTIPEAVSLIVQAGAIGGRGQVFVLDMGEPVKIVDLAREMIRLSGKVPGKGIEIEFTGIRPGEKLHEELWSTGEVVEPTVHPKISRATRAQIDTAWLEEELAELERLVEAGDTLELVARVDAMVGAPRRVPAAAPAQPA